MVVAEVRGGSPDVYLSAARIGRVVLSGETGRPPANESIDALQFAQRR
jgi:hypothetical protein